MSQTSQKLTFSKEQLSVVNAIQQRLVVRAAAGAGKTAVLVQRFLKHVSEDGYSPDAILTITFTKKAAAEMKRRIVRALEEAGLRQEAQIAETGPIQTIHSFCERLLREGCIEAGLDPDFVVLDNAEGARLLRDAIHLAIAGAEGPEDKLVEALAGKRERNALSPHARLEAAIQKAFLQLRGSGIDKSALLEKYSSPEALLENWQAAIMSSFDEALGAAFEESAPNEGFLMRVRSAHKALRRKALKGVPSPDKAQEGERANQACAVWSCALAGLAVKAWDWYEEGLVGRKALDYSGLETQALRLLTENEGVQERIRRQYRVAMVDEAQDLSPIQYALLDALGIATEMRVGDAHQSIYGFRQADVELFLERAERSDTLHLSTNYRSDSGLLTFVDSAFGRLWESRYLRMLPDSGLDGETREAAGVEIWRQPVKDTRQVAEWVEQLIIEGEEPGDIAVLVRVSNFAQDLLSKLEALGVPARIAGGTEKFYTRLEVRDLANALRAIEDPAEDFALLATLRSPVVGLSLDSIVLLSLQRPIFKALTDFQPPLDDDVEPLRRFMEWYLPLTAVGDRIGAWEALATIFAQSDYHANLARRHDGNQALANVRKLLQLASAHPEQSPKAYARLVRDVSELKHHEGDAPATNDEDPAVTLMTIHKAKGLEFPVVVCPDTHIGMARRREEVEIDLRTGMLTTSFGCDETPMIHVWNAEKRRLKEMAEEERLLYVAMTRAKRRLCLVADPQARANSAARLVADLIGLPGSLPPGVVERRFQRPDDAN